MEIEQIFTPTQIEIINMLIDERIPMQKKSTEDEYGQNWSMKQFMTATGRSRGWLKKHFLDSAEFKKIYSVEFGGFVYYPESDSTGGEYLFKVSGAKDFIENEMFKWKNGEKIA